MFSVPQGRLPQRHWLKLLLYYCIVEGSASSPPGRWRRVRYLAVKVTAGSHAGPGTYERWGCCRRSGPAVVECG